MYSKKKRRQKKNVTIKRIVRFWNHCALEQIQKIMLINITETTLRELSLLNQQQQQKKKEIINIKE